MIRNSKIIILWILFTLLWSVSLAQRWWVTGVTGVVLPGTQNVTTWAASQALVTTTIQNAINRVLGILAFIALLILLYAWFLMLTAAGNEDQYNKWFTILKQVALWLVFIWLAWIVVSMIFRLIDLITQ